MVSIDASRHKLREAQFFLAHLARVAKQTFPANAEEFHFYLSAFLSAARSVTFVLQFEEAATYKSWFSQWQTNQTTEDRDLLQRFNDQRVNVVHHAGADTSESTEFVPIAEVQIGGPGQPVYAFFWPGVPGTPPPQVARRLYTIRLSNSESEVIVACRRYLGLLEKLVEEFGAS
ncbi:MAG: hypothetical protein ACREBC_23825 [Pyrinomonadaceae bacterium]